MSDIENPSLSVFLDLAALYQQACEQSAEQQHRRILEMLASLRGCDDGDAAVSLVVKKLNRKRPVVRSLLPFPMDEEFNARMFDIARNRVEHLKGIFHGMPEAQRADGNAVANYTRLYANAILTACSTVKEAIEACRSMQVDPGDYISQLREQSDHKTTLLFHAQPTRFHDQLMRSILKCEIRMQLRELGAEWEFWDQEIAKSGDEVLDKVPGYYKRINRDPFAGASDFSASTPDPSPDDGEEDKACLDGAPNEDNGICMCTVADLRACVRAFQGNHKFNTSGKSMLEALIEQDGYVRQAAIPEDYKTIMSGFRDHFPNMAELADQIEGRFDLLTLAGAKAPAEIAGNMIVLDGPPGAGKTVALQWLTERMRIEYELISFAELSNGFDLSGQSRGWGTGKMGKVARLLLGQQVANPIIMLDELDKGHNNDDNFPPTKPLYTLLEKESAVRFSDEFLELKMDASHINWVATCNGFEAIPEPIRDRCRRIVISQPDQVQRITITKSLYRDMRKKNARLWGDLFAPEISDGVAYILASAPGISVRRLVDMVDQCVIETARRTSGKSTAQCAVIEDDAGKVIRRLKGASRSREPIGFVH